MSSSGRALDILSSSEEVLQAVLLDSSCRALNSWGLVSPKDESWIAKREPEQFVLAAPPIVPYGTFRAALVDAGAAPEDGGAIADDGGEGCADLDAGSTASFTVNSVSSASSVRLLRNFPSGVVVVAQAIASDQTTEVFGIEDWEFTCLPAETCTIIRLSASVVSLIITPGSGSHDLTAASSSQALMGKSVIELPRMP